MRFRLQPRLPVIAESQGVQSRKIAENCWLQNSNAVGIETIESRPGGGVQGLALNGVRVEVVACCQEQICSRRVDAPNFS